MTYFLLFIIALIVIEFIARKRYSKAHRLPFIPKQVGEYPYKEFIEECGPPLYWRLKAGYSKGQVHINSLGLRSPEPLKGCKRIWFAGESDLFGAKLAHEDKIWFKELQRLLDQSHPGYQVMNCSIIGYNMAQTAIAVNALPMEKGDILFLRANINDVSLAYIHGNEWKAGTPWPLDFVYKLERHKPWYYKLLDRSCAGMHLRKMLVKTEDRASAFAPKPGFQWQNLLDYQERKIRFLIEKANKRGVKPAFFDFAISYNETVTIDEEPKLAAIQSNWRGLVEGWSEYQFGNMEECVNRIALPLKIPVLRFRPHIVNVKDHYLLYSDLLHLNENGHKALAEAMYTELQASNLLTDGDLK